MRAQWNCHFVLDVLSLIWAVNKYYNLGQWLVLYNIVSVFKTIIGNSKVIERRETDHRFILHVHFYFPFLIYKIKINIILSGRKLGAEKQKKWETSTWNIIQEIQCSVT